MGIRFIFYFSIEDRIFFETWT